MPESSESEVPHHNLELVTVVVAVTSRGSTRFLFVVIDTFTKWMEAMLVVNITQQVAVKFLQSIIYPFGVPRRILTDNGT
jgi:ABC-type uncharacterized transport system permease subunit